MPTFRETAAGYRALWAKAIIKSDHVSEAQKLARQILNNKSRYEDIAQRTGVPWFMIGVIHLRESGLNFAGVLHNGQRIIGTGRKTTLVPAGRGPFSTWENAAVDALTMPPHELHKIKSWPIERILFELERYNGFGYFGKINSPYVWSWTNLYIKGKYVADGKYDPTHVDQQPGCAAVMKAIAKLDATVAAAIFSTVAVPQITQETPQADDLPRLVSLLREAMMIVEKLKG